MHINRTASICMLALLVGLVGVQAANAQFGPIISGAGPVSRSMGGTGTAAAVSPAGPLMWNPAALAGLRRNELEVGAELLLPQTNLTSSIPAGSLGPGVPAVDLSGSTDNQDTIFALPTIALSYSPEESPWTYGLGIYALAGFGLDYPASATNPLLTPQPPTGLGFGALYSSYQVLQIAPALVYDVDEAFSVSFSPLLNLGTAQLDPAVFAAPNDANGDGFATYPAGTHSQTAWGAGFQLGAHYRPGPWSFGASYKSPQWFESYSFNTVNELGLPAPSQFAIDLPAIYSVGVAREVTPELLLAADLRYLDFESAKGFGDRGFNADGSLRGIGLQSIFAMSLGAQYQMTECLAARMGYSWNESAVPDSQTTANVASPLIVEHMLSFGAGWKVNNSLTMNAAYMHAFENSISSVITPPTGPIPGTRVSSSTSVDMFIFGATVAF